MKLTSLMALIGAVSASASSLTMLAQKNAKKPKNTKPEGPIESCWEHDTITLADFVAMMIKGMDTNTSGGICLEEATKFVNKYFKAIGYCDDLTERIIEVLTEHFEEDEIQEIPVDEFRDYIAEIYNSDFTDEGLARFIFSLAE